jgi:hypothetical protein
VGRSSSSFSSYPSSPALPCSQQCYSVCQN